MQRQMRVEQLLALLSFMCVSQRLGVLGGNSFFFIVALLSLSFSKRVCVSVCVQVSIGTGECDQTGEKWRGTLWPDWGKLLFGIYFSRNSLCFSFESKET